MYLYIYHHPSIQLTHICQEIGLSLLQKMAFRQDITWLLCWPLVDHTIDNTFQRRCNIHFYEQQKINTKDPPQWVVFCEGNSIMKIPLMYYTANNAQTSLHAMASSYIILQILMSASVPHVWTVPIVQMQWMDTAVLALRVLMGPTVRQVGR